MSDATAPAEDLALENDFQWSPTGTIGYLILLSGTLLTGTWTVDASTDMITTAAAHGLVTGGRIRLTTTGSLPSISSGTLNGSTDYYAIVLSTTTLKLATTIANAQAGTAIDFTDTGSGTHTFTEQRLVNSDPISVLINKELSHPSYSRQAIAALGAAIAVGAFGEKAPKSFTFSTSGAALTFRHVLFLRGATSEIGNTTGTVRRLTTESADVAVTAGAPKIITFVFRTRNP